MPINHYYTGWCDNCGDWETDGISNRKPDAIKHLKAMGWKVTRTIILCPLCKKGNYHVSN